MTVKGVLEARADMEVFQEVGFLEDIQVEFQEGFLVVFQEGIPAEVVDFLEGIPAEVVDFLEGILMEVVSQGVSLVAHQRLERRLGVLVKSLRG